MRTPPAAGVMTMGTRRKIDWIEKPSVRRSDGRTSPITANRVGLAMLLHAMTSIKPTKATPHDGASAISADPTDASTMKTRSAARRP